MLVLASIIFLNQKFENSIVNKDNNQYHSFNLHSHHDHTNKLYSNQFYSLHTYGHYRDHSFNHRYIQSNRHNRSHTVHGHYIIQSSQIDSIVSLNELTKNIANRMCLYQFETSYSSTRLIQYTLLLFRTFSHFKHDIFEAIWNKNVSIISNM